MAWAKEGYLPCVSLSTVKQMFSGFIIRLMFAFVLAACNSWISFSLGDMLVYSEAADSSANM
jgi:hypothetical protein